MIIMIIVMTMLIIMMIIMLAMRMFLINVVTVCQNDQRFLLLDVMLWQLDRSINTAAQDKHHHITDCW